MLVLKIVGAIVLAVVLLAVGCSVLINEGVESVQKETAKSAITEDQFKSVKTGTPIADVKDDLGEPDDEQVTKVKGMRSVCIYYPVANGETLSMFQFCFTNGRLESKSRY